MPGCPGTLTDQSETRQQKDATLPILVSVEGRPEHTTRSTAFQETQKVDWSQSRRQAPCLLMGPLIINNVIRFMKAQR